MNILNKKEILITKAKIMVMVFDKFLRIRRSNKNINRLE